MNRLWLIALPDIRRFPANEQPRALEQARDTPLETLEFIGMAAGLVAVTALTRYSVPDLKTASQLAAVLLNFVVAVPLLAALLGPFHLRRLRRGLRVQLQNRTAP